MMFNRPEKYNAFTPEMYRLLSRAYYQIQHDPEIRCGLLVGEGSHFSAGLDLEQWAPSMTTGESLPLGDDAIDPFGIKGERLMKPVVVAIQGICFTSGLELMLNTEIRLSTKDARYAQMEVKRGIYPLGGGTVRLPRQIGWGNAQLLLMTGDEFSGEDAYRFGLVQKIEPIENLYCAAMEIVEKICDLAPLAIQASLKSSRTAVLQGEEHAMSELHSNLPPVAQSEDAKEGLMSFLERRKAVFKGR